jgi:hypothetical protein
MFVFVALSVSFYRVSLKASQLRLLVSLKLTRRFMCLCPGSSVTVLLVDVGLSERN